MHIQSELRPPLIGIRRWGSVAVLVAAAVIVVEVTSGQNPAQIVVMLSACVGGLALIVAAAEAIYALIKR